MKKLAFLFVGITFFGCNPSSMDDMTDFDWQGHRGARGNYPENTTPAFFYALDAGMTTLEMDVVITADSQVVVSHEPFFSNEICKLESLAADSLPNNIYELSYSQVSGVDCGSIGNPKFTNQQKMVMAKPLLKDVIQAAEQYALQTHRSLPYYNVEIKSRPEWDNQYHPAVEVYTTLVMDVLKHAELEYRATIQSFDDRPLQYLHQKYPELTLALLVEDSLSAEDHLTKLGFTPAIYSCYYPLVTKDLVDYCHSQGMKLIPWTVNEAAEIRRLRTLGVDGIITDYPLLKKEVN